jgi:hypothetical protein
MRKLFRRRSSAALIVAIVALVAAIGGTAVAGGGFLQQKKFNKFKSTALTRLTYVNNTVSIPTNGGSTYQHISANCPSGYHAVGGGVKLTPGDTAFWVGDGYLTTSGYAADVFNGTANAGQAVVTVSCVAANATGSPASA